MELSLEGWIFDLQRSRRGSQGEYEERQEDQNGWGLGRRSPGAWEGRGQGGVGGPRKATLRNFDFTWRAMARRLKILETVHDLVGFV